MNKPQSNLVYTKGYGKNYANLRKKEFNSTQDFTVRELSKKLLISSSTISQIENEKREPTVEQVLAYKNFFGVSLDYLVGETTVINSDLINICKYTGLNEKSIESILQLTAYHESQYVDEREKQRKIYESKVNALNYVICSDFFHELVHGVADMQTITESLTNYLEFALPSAEKTVDFDNSEKSIIEMRTLLDGIGSYSKREEQNILVKRYDISRKLEHLMFEVCKDDNIREAKNRYEKCVQIYFDILRENELQDDEDYLFRTDMSDYYD